MVRVASTNPSETNLTPLHTRLLCLLLPCLTPVVAAQSTIANINGTLANGLFGTASDEIGDINGDGYQDLVVGVPNPTGIGWIDLISGKYLATGIQPKSLGTVSGGLFYDPSLGLGVLGIADITGDGIPDVVACGLGRVSIISGLTKQIVAGYSWGGAGQNFRGPVVSLNDIDGDGYKEVGVSFSGNLFNSPRVELISVRHVVTGSGAIVLASIYGTGGTDWGVLSAGDLDGDGKFEIVVGEPGANSNAGKVNIYRGTDNVLFRVLDGTPGSRFGASVDASRDVDLDGRKDVLVGATDTIVNGLSVGEVALFSGLKIANNTGPFDMARWYGTQAGAHFGAVVRLSPDINGDFYTDIIASAPDHDVFPGISFNNGRVQMFSGKTLEPLGGVVGAKNEHLGGSLSRAWDYTGDIRFEFVAGAPLNDSAGTDSGSLRVISLFPAIPATYCTGKLNSQGCTPAMAYSGSPSLSSPASFLVTASQVINNTIGILIYAFDAGSMPFQGGTLCIGAPLTRTAGQVSGGNAGPDDCSGVLSFNFNALIQSGSVPALKIQGAEVFAQYWSRDVAHPTKSSLSNALRFVVNP